MVYAVTSKVTGGNPLKVQILLVPPIRKYGRAADRTSLENWSAVKGTVGSNPTASAKYGFRSLEVKASPCEGGEVRALLIGHPMKRCIISMGLNNIIGARLKAGQLTLTQLIGVRIPGTEP